MKYIRKPINETTSMVVRDMTKEAWNDLIAHPYVESEKANVPLAIWGRMVDNPELDKYGYAHCVGYNVKYIYALQVDVDNGCTIEEFVRDFHRYSFQLYTSYSYGVFKPGDRFRVIFPLKERLYMAHLVRPVKDVLINLFSMSDVSCFDKGHFQCLPAISSNDAPYRYIQHSGELLSFAHENFAQMAQQYYDDFEQKIKNKSENTEGDHEGALKWVQKIFDTTPEGARNTTVYSKTRWLAHDVGCSYSEIVSLSPPAGFPFEEFYGIVERQFR